MKIMASLQAFLTLPPHSHPPPLHFSPPQNPFSLPSNACHIVVWYLNIALTRPILKWRVYGNAHVRCDSFQNKMYRPTLNTKKTSTSNPRNPGICLCNRPRIFTDLVWHMQMFLVSLLYDGICLRIDVLKINYCLNILFIIWFLYVFYSITFVLWNSADPT